MARFFGTVGYAETVETKPGVWEEQITERQYTGDVLHNSRKWVGSEYLNDNLEVSNRISIVADPFAYQNFQSIRFVEWMGTRWKVPTVEVERPRLILSIGGVYNGDKA